MGRGIFEGVEEGGTPWVFAYFQGVLDAALSAMDWLWAESEAVMDRVRRITKRAAKAPPSHDIHQTLAATHLFEFLRTGRSECEAYIASLIEACDTPLAVHELLPQLHPLRRVGG